MSYRPLIYDEAILGKKVYENGYIDDLRWADVLPLAKYMRFTFGYGDARLKTKLEEFFSRDPNFNKVRMRGYIGKIINHSRRKYKNTKTVNITENELLKIREIKNFKWQKIILSLLFISKRATNNGYVRLNEWTDVKSSACISNLRIFEIENAVTALYQIPNRIRPIEREKTDASHQILFIDDASKIVFTIKNDKTARNLGNLYKEWCGGELYWCKECGNEFIKNNSNRHNYCTECSETRRLERVKINMKKYRSQSNLSSVII